MYTFTPQRQKGKKNREKHGFPPVVAGGNEITKMTQDQKVGKHVWWRFFPLIIVNCFPTKTRAYVPNICLAKTGWCAYVHCKCPTLQNLKVIVRGNYTYYEY